MAAEKRSLGEEATRIADLAARVLEGDAWHAGNIVDLLEDVTAAEAHAHPVPGAHSIWELVLHMTAWADEVRGRLTGAEAGEPDTGDWPKVGRATATRWTQARAALVASYRALQDALGNLSVADLNHRVTDHRDPAPGLGLSRYVTVHGVIHHAVYHAGQIALLKRALER